MSRASAQTAQKAGAGQKTETGRKKGRTDAPAEGIHEPPPGARGKKRDRQATPEVDPHASRLFEMPYSAVEPRLINREIGLHNLVTRAGHNAAYLIEVTLLDTPDHRLLRSGVVLAHRVLDGRGEWYLGAPAWTPCLPTEHVAPMGAGDLPESLADLVRPFRRRAALGPIAGLACDRREYALRDDASTTLALLRDDRVTVRRAGLTTARYREVTFTPVGQGLTADQVRWLERALGHVGATPVAAFAPLVARLGAPATGPTDFPQPRPVAPDGPAEKFVGTVLTRRLRAFVEADLAFRSRALGSGAPPTAEALPEVVTDLRDDLRGLDLLLDPDWAEDLSEELEWLGGVLEPSGSAGGHAAPEDGFRGRLRSERYLALLDRLVGAARAPRLRQGNGVRVAGNWVDAESTDVVSAREAVIGAVTEAVRRLEAAADRLLAEDSVSAWTEATAAATALRYLLRVTLEVLGKRGVKLGKEARQAAKLVRLAGMHANRAAGTRAAVDALTPEQAFTAGVAYAEQVAAHSRARREFVASWPAVLRKLRL